MVLHVAVQLLLEQRNGAHCASVEQELMQAPPEQRYPGLQSKLLEQLVPHVIDIIMSKLHRYAPHSLSALQVVVHTLAAEDEEQWYPV